MSALGNVTLADVERQRSELLARVDGLRTAHAEAKRKKHAALAAELQTQMNDLFARLRELKRLRGDTLFANEDPRLARMRLYVNAAQETLDPAVHAALWQEAERRYDDIMRGIADRRGAQSTGAAVAPIGEPGPMRVRREARA